MFTLYYLREKKSSVVLVAQLCLTPFDPMDCSPPGSSVHGILQPRMLEWVAMLFSMGSSQPRDRTQVSMSVALASRFFTTSATRKTPYIKQITNKNLLYSTGNSTQYSVMTYMGKESKSVYMSMYNRFNLPYT